VTVSLSAMSAEKMTTISCKFKADAGKGTVPKAALGKLFDSPISSISINTSTSETFDQDGWRITATALRPAKAGTSLAAGSITVE
jgi:hypothetical protein